MKARLSGTHKSASLGLLEQARDNPAYEAAIRSDLARPEIAEDVEVRRAAEKLRLAIASLPTEVKTLYAINIRLIEADGALLFDNIEGVLSDKVSSKGDMTFRNVIAPPGK